MHIILQRFDLLHFPCLALNILTPLNLKEYRFKVTLTQSIYKMPTSKVTFHFYPANQHPAIKKFNYKIY